MTVDQQHQAPLADRVSLLESQIHTVSRLATDILSAQRSIQGALREIRTRAGSGLTATATGRKAEDDPEAFGTWVLWLVQTYDLLLEWPQCWYRHAGLVEELRALREFHRGLGAELADDPRAGFSWHDALWRFRDRGVKPVKCPLSGHIEPTEQMVESRKQEVARFRAGCGDVKYGLVAQPGRNTADTPGSPDRSASLGLGDPSALEEPSPRRPWRQEVP